MPALQVHIPAQNCQKIISIFDGHDTVRDPSPFSSVPDNFNQDHKSNCSLNGAFYQFSIIGFQLLTELLQFDL